MRRLIPVVLLLTALPLAAAEVYKYTDDDGNVVYTDRPVPGAELVNVEAPFLGGGPAPRRSPAAPGPEPAEDAAAAEGGDGEPTPEQRAERRAENCEQARQRHERYMSSHRLYRETSDGEREYLSSEEIDEARARAAADVEQWCN